MALESHEPLLERQKYYRRQMEGRYQNEDETPSWLTPLLEFSLHHRRGDEQAPGYFERFHYLRGKAEVARNQLTPEQVDLWKEIDMFIVNLTDGAEWPHSRG